MFNLLKPRVEFDLNRSNVSFPGLCKSEDDFFASTVCFLAEELPGWALKTLPVETEKRPMAAQRGFCLGSILPLRPWAKDPTAASGTALTETAEMPRYRGDGSGLGSAAHNQVSWRVRCWWWPTCSQLMPQQHIVYASVKKQNQTSLFLTFSVIK